MRKIVEYRLTSESYRSTLNDTVNDLITEGWQPFGNFFVDKDEYYYQAMVRYEDEEDC